MFVNVISSTNSIIGNYQTSNIQKPDVFVVNKSDNAAEHSYTESILDKAEISQESKNLLDQEKTNKRNANISEQDLNSKEKAELEKLKKTDTEVKAHEQAHMSAAAGIATSSPQYEYEKGPDGKMYAIGGEVNIKIAEESTPEKTIEKAEQVKKAALAPSEPSAQDRSVAQRAEQLIQKAKNAYKTEQSNSIDAELTNGIKKSQGLLMEVFG